MEGIGILGQSPARTTVIVLSVVVAVSFVLGLGIGVVLRAPTVQIASATSDALFQSCIDGLSGTGIRPTASTQQQTNDLNNVATCYNQVRAQLTLRDFELRRQMISKSVEGSQRMTLVAMVILLFATTSGVVLSGLQMLASFRLMSKGYEQMGVNAELVLRYNSIALRSSAVGVSIFAISMIFFGVFILYTYQISEAPRPAEALPQLPPGAIQ